MWGRFLSRQEEDRRTPWDGRDRRVTPCWLQLCCDPEKVKVEAVWRSWHWPVQTCPALQSQGWPGWMQTCLLSSAPSAGLVLCNPDPHIPFWWGTRNMFFTHHSLLIGPWISTVPFRKCSGQTGLTWWSHCRRAGHRAWDPLVMCWGYTWPWSKPGRWWAAHSTALERLLWTVEVQAQMFSTIMIALTTLCQNIVMQWWCKTHCAAYSTSRGELNSGDGRPWLNVTHFEGRQTGDVLGLTLSLQQI